MGFNTHEFGSWAYLLLSYCSTEKVRLTVRWLSPEAENINQDFTGPDKHVMSYELSGDTKYVFLLFSGSM